MPYTAEQIRSFIRGGENQKVEFKRDIKDRSILGQLIASFANADGGVIIVGVQEPEEVVGADTNRLASLFNAALARTTPRPNAKFDTVDIDDKALGIISVEPAEVIVISERGAFVRSGAASRAMSPSEIFAKVPKQTDDIQTQLKVMAEALAANTSMIEQQQNTINEQSDLVRQQTATIERLRQQLQEAARLRNKIPDYIWGGIFGVIITVIASLLFGLPA